MSERQLFKVGDKVRRIEGEFAGCRLGSISTVRGFKPSATLPLVGLDSMLLEEYGDFWFDQNYFTLESKSIPVSETLGRKDDSGKVRMELLNDMPRAIKGVAEVLHWAVTDKKPKPYVPGSWQHVDNYYARYTGALMRHQNNIATHGQFAKDKETNLLDLKHLACDILILLELTLREQESKA